MSLHPRPPTEADKRVRLGNEQIMRIEVRHIFLATKRLWIVRELQDFTDYSAIPIAVTKPQGPHLDWPGIVNLIASRVGTFEVNFVLDTIPFNLYLAGNPHKYCLSGEAKFFDLAVIKLNLEDIRPRTGSHQVANRLKCEFRRLDDRKDLRDLNVGDRSTIFYGRRFAQVPKMLGKAPTSSEKPRSANRSRSLVFPFLARVFGLRQL
jgi:hypothetical protein